MSVYVCVDGYVYVCYLYVFTSFWSQLRHFLISRLSRHGLTLHCDFPCQGFVEATINYISWIGCHAMSPEVLHTWTLTLQEGLFLLSFVQLVYLMLLFQKLIAQFWIRFYASQRHILRTDHSPSSLTIQRSSTLTLRDATFDRSWIGWTKEWDARTWLSTSTGTMSSRMPSETYTERHQRSGNIDFT